MNEKDNRAKAKAVDSLLNFETVSTQSIFFFFLQVAFLCSTSAKTLLTCYLVGLCLWLWWPVVDVITFVKGFWLLKYAKGSPVLWICQIEAAHDFYEKVRFFY